VLTASHITRRFGERVAVDDVSFQLVPGEIFALLGPNGAGKTTTLRMLAGLIRPTEGTISIGGEPLTPANAPRIRGRVGFLTETPGLWERLDVRRNLLVYARLHGLADPERSVDAALDAFDMHARAADVAAHLSKGLKQRVALARTLLHQPDIVLLDEPTAGLDPESARDVRDLILRLRSERRVVIVSTHNLDEVERIATRVAILRSSLVAMDTPARLRERLFGVRVRVVISQPAYRFVHVLRDIGFTDAAADGAALSIGVKDAADAAPHIVRTLVEAGADVQTVTAEQPPLEQVYLKLVAPHSRRSPEADRS
jgi:ABC-2 type transport system ATP-binding protein